MPSNHLILCHPLLFLPSIFPSIRVFSNESVLCIRWPKYWSFSFSISPSGEYSGLISFRMDGLDLLAVQGTLKSLLQHHSSKALTLRRSAFFTVQLSHPYMTTGKTSVLSHVQFFVTPWTSSPGSPVHGIHHSRILEWVAIFYSMGSSPPRDWTCVCYLSCTSRLIYHSGKPSYNAVDQNAVSISYHLDVNVGEEYAQLPSFQLEWPESRAKQSNTHVCRLHTHS